MRKLYDVDCIPVNIGIARTKAGMTQQELADATGIDRSTIAKYESGQRKAKIEHIKAIAMETNTTTDFLLGLTDTPTKDASLRAACDYTYLSEECVEILHQYESPDLNEFISLLAYNLGVSPFPLNLGAMEQLGNTETEKAKPKIEDGYLILSGESAKYYNKLDLREMVSTFVYHVLEDMYPRDNLEKQS